MTTKAYNEGRTKQRKSEMSYREIVKNSRVTTENVNTLSREIGIHIAYFASGLLVSKGAVLQGLSPFGASLISAVPFSYMPSGLLGTIVGYMMKNSVDSFRYIAVIISIGALRWVLNEFKRVSMSRFFPCVVAFVPMFLTGIVLTYSSQSELTQITTCLLEASLAAVSAYFLNISSTLLASSKSLLSLTNQEIACLSMSGCILLLAFSSLMIGDFSVGRILAVLVILICARYGGVSVGSISGIATGIVFSLQSVQMMFLCCSFAFSGLVGGLFAPISKMAVASIVFLCNTTLAFTSEDATMVFAVSIETATAAVIFMLLPKSLGNYMTNVFSSKSESADNEAVRRSVIMRLSFASKALSGVSDCVNSVSKKLSRLYTQNAQWVYDNASERTCKSCGMRYYCFEKCKDMTYKDFHSLTSILKQNGCVNEKDLEENFKKRCCKIKELANSINQSYKEYLSLESANRRITQVRSVVAGQFAGLSDILQDMAEEFEEYEKYDIDASNRVIDRLSSLSLAVVECSCRVSKGKGMVVEVEIIITKKTTISKSQLTHEISHACGRRFESPAISYAGDRARIVLCERPTFDVEIGSAQHICNNGELCGDCINYFNNGTGSTVMILADGMGSGGRAAVDSNMAASILTKLCKAGLSYDCALSVVNSSLMIKSEDESLSTLDVVDFNLFSGKADILKAGACVTYIKKNSRIIRKDMSSLPVGILNEVRFMKESVTLTDGDLILMVSDGAVFADDKWIEKLMLKFDSESIEELAFEVVDQAKKRRNDGHDDDITALAVKVIEN